MTSPIVLGALLSMTTSSLAAPPVTVPFDSGRWRIDALESRVEKHLGRRSLRLRGGTAVLADTRIADGAIEFDVAFGRERGFVGGIWRVTPGDGYEEFYLRPHQSGNPDATQYSPVFHGVSGWQLYHGERHAVPLVHRFDEWTRVRIVFAGTQAEVYIGDLARPALFIDDLRRGAVAGAVGLSASRFAPAHFANFSYTPAAPPFRSRPGKPAEAPPGVIPSWEVSDPFPESTLEGRAALGPDHLAGRHWTRLAAESSGLANLARVHAVAGRNDTVFARRVIVADRERTVRLDFGFSDRIRVYLNGRLLFRGDDGYQSRDYRFLGSIGFFDALYLPLVAGENELLLAVSEDVVRGGWGVQAKLGDLAGVTLKD